MSIPTVRHPCYFFRWWGVYIFSWEKDLLKIEWDFEWFIMDFIMDFIRFIATPINPQITWVCLRWSFTFPRENTPFGESIGDICHSWGLLKHVPLGFSTRDDAARVLGPGLGECDWLVKKAFLDVPLADLWLRDVSWAFDNELFRVCIYRIWLCMIVWYPLVI